MKIKMQITLDKDGSEEKLDLVADDRDVRAYESEFSSNWLTTELSYTQLGQLAWLTARRQGKFKGSWDVFNAMAVEVTNAPDPDEEEAGEVTPTRPTKKAASAG
jgi:hypothetical protein